MSYRKEQDFIFTVFDDTWGKNLENDCDLNKQTEIFIIDKIKDALIAHNYNQSRASRSLGIKRTTFIAKCKKFGLL